MKTGVILWSWSVHRLSSVCSVLLGVAFFTVYFVIFDRLHFIANHNTRRTKSSLRYMHHCRLITSPLSEPMTAYFHWDTNHIPDQNGYFNPHPFNFTLTPPREIICGHQKKLVDWISFVTFTSLKIFMLFSQNDARIMITKLSVD